MRPTVLTVFYPAMRDHAAEYLQCVAGQTMSGIHLLIVDDDYPGDIRSEAAVYDLDPTIIHSSAHHQTNRLRGLQYCLKNDCDPVIISDADETMYPDRVERIINFFQQHPQVRVVYNNSVAEGGQRSFDLHYKEQLKLEDLMDFNVLGFGAMNIRQDHIPFILEHENLEVYAFDWWLALVYLLRHEELQFLPDVKNHYRSHDGNYVGPLLDIEIERIRLGLDTKESIYRELIDYCQQHELPEQATSFRAKLLEIRQIRNFLVEKSLETYADLVREHFKYTRKLYWWQDVVSINQLNTGSQT